MFQKTVVSVIKEYFWQSSKNMVSKKYGKEFIQDSYSKWAVKEILMAIENNPDFPPTEVIEKFKDKMNEYACLNRNSSYIFSIAYDMAQEILNLFL